MGIGMDKSAALLLVLFFLTASCIMAKPAFSSATVVEDTWTAKASMQQARAGLGVVAVNGKIYAIGGTTASGQYPPDCFAGGFVGTNEEYDPETDTWTTKASMPTPRDYFAIAGYQNKIYCIGGAIGFTVDEWGLFHSYVASGVNEVYDTVTNTWETKTPMPVVGMKIQAHVINGKIYVMGVAFTYVYDPENDSWTSRTRMPASPPPSSGSYPVSVVVDDKIVVSGEFSTGSSSSEQKILIYDTETDSWSEGKSGPTVVVGGAAGATTGANALQRVYIFGSAYGQYPVVPATNQVYDPMADAWSTATAMPALRRDFGVVVVDEVLYVIGGYSYTTDRYDSVEPVAVNEQYTPLGYGTPDPFYVLAHTPPEVSILSPLNQTYYNSSVSLIFTVDKPVNWTSYSLDGELNVTVAGNTTLTGLIDGSHSLVIYANDTLGNMGASQTVTFTIATPPKISILSPLNQTYTESNVPLIFTLDKPVNCTCYSLDGQDNVTITGNTTLSELANGLHNVTVYAKGEFENMGASETICFSVEVPFPVVPLAVASVATVAVVGVGLLVYFKKRKH
jgi:hypothetical protein